MPGFTVAIVGRPNVGKSTLFNRLLEQRKAIIDDFSGVTRDRQYGIADWNGKVFNLIDTGGFVAQSDDVFEREIRKQVHIALEEADLLIFVCDVTTGITDQDAEMAEVLRKSNKKTLLAVNKVDNSERALDATEFYSLGFEHTFFISSISGSGSGELLDEVALNIPQKEEREEESPLPKFAIIGQPNAGKSTLLNALTGEERTIVSDIAGTTRDTIHTHYKQFGKEFILIDTAGIRKKKNVHENLEFYSVIRAIRAMDEADVCIQLIDAEVGVTAQDISIFSLAARKGKGVILLVNKWDLIKDKETNTAKQYEELIYKRIAPFKDVPIIFISAAEKKRIFQAMEKALEVYDNRQRKIPTSKLNDIMLKEIESYPPPLSRGYSIKIKFVTQLPVVVPSFAFYANYPDAVKEPYKNFLENKIRSHFNFSGVPVRIFMRNKDKKREDKDDKKR
ncbi:MAG: ribosome biogenesis GTPase Der [Flavipsychrobacter sp.]